MIYADHDQSYRGLMKTLTSCYQFLHHHLFFVLLSMYALAMLAPGPGVSLREFTLPLTGLKMPSLLLSLLLFNAGFSVRSSELGIASSRMRLLITTLILNSLIPILFIAFIALTMSSWLNLEEGQVILVALAIVGAMPIAGASTTWAQQLGGNLSLSLGLVVCSTLLSPLLTPLVLKSAALWLEGSYKDDVLKLVGAGGANFLLFSVVIPSLAGMLLRKLLQKRNIEASSFVLKFLSVIALMVLNYSNASTSLPALLLNPDWIYLMVLALITTALCVLLFAMGFATSKIFKSDRDERASVMFGLGMNNNGTGLVLASLFLKGSPAVMLPIVMYNLVQQLVAGATQKLLLRSASAKRGL